jgi:hypothetical protein
MLNCTRLEMLVRDKHSSLLDHVVSYKECCEYGPNTVKHSGFVIYRKWAEFVVS